jgi:ABC-type glycerol-3-phosphate transport system permease component
MIAIIAAAIFAFPIWFMVTSAFKAESEVQAIPLHLLPHHFQGLSHSFARQPRLRHYGVISSTHGSIRPRMPL